MILLLMSVLACSRDRLFPIEDKYPQSAGSGITFVNKVPEEMLRKAEVVTIKSSDDSPFVTKNGNKIYLRPSDFNKISGGKAVTYPFRLEVTELLTIKDIILNNKPTVSNGRLLSTDGQILIRAYKDDIPLSLYWNNSFYIEMKGMNKGLPDPEMEIFLGAESQNGSSDVAWREDTTKSCNEIQQERYKCRKLTAIDSVYMAFPSKLGWINVDKFIDYTNTTILKFKSDADLINIYTYLLFPDLNSVMRVYHDEEFPLPIGEKARVISFSFTEDDVVYAFFEDIVIQPNLEINIKLSKTTKEALVAELEKL